jgi:hypothetical protein
VFEFGDGITSVVTAVLLCHTDGTPIREDGKLRVWFTGAELTKPGGKHVLYDATAPLSIAGANLRHLSFKIATRRTVIKEGSKYRMWYTDVSVRPWKFRHAGARRNALERDGKAGDGGRPVVGGAHSCVSASRQERRSLSHVVWQLLVGQRGCGSVAHDGDWFRGER